MRLKLLALLIVLSVFSKAQSSKALNVVKINMQLQELAWNSGSIDSFMDFYWKHDSLKFIGSKGITYGWLNTLNNYKKSYPDKAAMGILKFNIIEAKQVGKNYIYVIGKWQLTKDKPVGGHFTLLWQKIGKKWVIISDHTS